jgi:erythromycin esterase-like protein
VIALSLLVLAPRFLGPRGEPHSGQFTGASARRESVADMVVRDMCGKRVALLGESPTHGFGRTLELKVEIARRLVNECGYNAFFIESGAYDFLNIQKALESRQSVTGPMIAAAIGGLWANKEVEPLIPFLLEKTQRGTLVLGGLDDQLGRGTYAQQQMPDDLASLLDGDDRTRCLAILRKHMLWQYTNEAPYGPKDKALILGCLGEIDIRLSSPGNSGHAYERAMVENLKRYFARDFTEELRPAGDLETQSFNDRDRSMSMNFAWLMLRLPARSKVIGWTATIHAAKSLSGVPGREKFVPLGSYIRREFKDESFVLGISAFSGSYAMGRQPPRALSAAPASSFEGLAFAEGQSDSRYFNRAQIRELGPRPARPLGPDFSTANWSDVLDGLVVFREEHPPHVSGQ